MVGPMRYEPSLRISLYPIPAALNALGVRTSQRNVPEVWRLASKKRIIVVKQRRQKQFKKKKSPQDGRDNDHIVQEW